MSRAESEFRIPKSQIEMTKGICFDTKQMP